MSGAVHGLLASLAGVIKDTFFRYVTLLLNTSATNGAQNNTFLDGSTNAFSITRNGNPTQGNFSPFSQTGWSNFFDGTGDYLTTASSGTAAGAFTYEAWVYQTAATTGLVITVGSEAADRTYMYVTSGQQLGWGVFAVGDYTLGGTVPLNQWNHIAIVRSGTTVTGYVNGTALGTTTTYSGTAGNANGFAVGANKAGGTPFTGYISNARVVNGTAVYTANFTPPTAPLTAITNTSLLTCQSNRFIDNSSNAFAITRNGDVSVQAFSPFAPTAAWSASTNGGSGYFDGTGDYLTAASNAAFGLGTGDFTIEMWVYATANPANGPGTIFDLRTGITSTATACRVNSSLNVLFYDGPSNIEINVGTIQLNTWTHIAHVRASGSLKTYINGSLSNTTTVTSDLGTNQPCMIGNNQNAGYAWNGYQSNFRIVKGTAVYTANFTPPTAPLTAITNTSLLLNFTNAGIYDSAAGNDLETVGNAQVSTTQAKWGTTSMAFDGTGDWLFVIDQPILRLGTAAFTIEMWVYRSASGTYGLISKGTSTTGWSVSLNASNQVVFSFASSSFNSTGTVAATTWTHIAVVREGTGTNQTKIYINGTNDGTGTVATDFNQTNAMYVGADRVAGGNFNGYIDDLRVTNGYARYTANFTAPTAAFPLQ